VLGLDTQTAVREEPNAEVRPSRSWWGRGAVWILLLFGFLWAVGAGVSLLVQHSRLRGELTARLEAAFGRRVEVGSYAFSIWDGPVLEARSVRIGEDPRFGNEYFLRSESISIGLRWWSLLRGHIELGTLSLTHPSFNLVRAADGDWNLAEWLPRPATPELTQMRGRASPMAPPALRFRRIEVEEGRINFKRGYDKLPFAFVGVNGTVETDSPGRWRIDLQATPWRAAVITQQPGVIHVTGHVGGTSSRLRPAALDISWTDASIADFFRLLRGDDYGVRGRLDIFVSAHTEPRVPMNGWVLNGHAGISQLHRWDLASRPDNPSVYVVADQVLLDPSLSELRIADAKIEAPHSSATANAAFSWTGAPPVRNPPFAQSDFADLTSSRIDLGDVLAWARAFYPGVAVGTSVRGAVDARAHLSGWPPRLVTASITGEGVDVSGPGLREPAHVEPIDFRYSHGAVSLRPATLSWGPSGDRAASSFRIDASTRPQLAMFPAWHIVGSTVDVRDLIAMAAAFGWNISRGWDLRGPFSCDLRWRGTPFPWDALPVGAITLGALETRGASLAIPFLNRSIDGIRARAELKPDVRRITLASAQAFDSDWSGTLDRRSADAEWHFALQANRLSAAWLDRWLNPRWRESFLDRMLPFLASHTAYAAPSSLRASGSLSLGEFLLQPLIVQRLQGNLKINGRHVEFSDAHGQFYGGTLSGLARADLSASPTYHVEIHSSNVNASALAAAAPALTDLRGDAADGQISIDASGATRSDLIASLACRGTLHVTGLELLSIDLQRPLATPDRVAHPTVFPAASAAFRCAHRTIELQNLSLASPPGRLIDGSGTVSFSRDLDIRLQNLSSPDARPGATYQLTGTLSAPQIRRLQPLRRPR
jgi:AsmA family